MAFTAHTSGGFEKTETNRLFTEPAMITQVDEESKVSKKGNPYVSYTVYVKLKAELVGNNPFEGKTNFMLYNKKGDQSLFTHFLEPMGIQLQTQKINGKEMKGYDPQHLVNKRCMVIMYDDYYVSKETDDGNRYINSYPKPFACVPDNYAPDKIDILVNDALNFSLKSKQIAEEKMSKLQTVSSTSMGDITYTMDEQELEVSEAGLPF